MKYHVATHCQRCNSRYRTRASNQPKAPERCKNCKSSKTEEVENPEDHKEFFSSETVIPVRSGDSQ